jgi:hypothetical protein
MKTKTRYTRREKTKLLIRQFRVPRKTKKAKNKLYLIWNGVAYVSDLLRPGDWRRIQRCTFMGRRNPRAVAAHVAMGDTTTARLRQRRERAYQRSERTRTMDDATGRRMNFKGR